MTRLCALLLSASLAGVPLRAAEPAPAVDLGFTLDPIVITAPRLKLPPERVIDPRINALLLRLLEQQSEQRPQATGSAPGAAAVFAGLTTLTGRLLSQRYSQLGFLLTEGLAGSQDPVVQSALENVARTAVNPQMRAAAMVSLAYTKDERYVALFQQALQDPDLTVRLGAFESLMLSGSPSAQASIPLVASSDASPTMKILAAAAYWQGGNLSGRETLLTFATNSDWYVRASAIYNIGRLGGGDEYRKLFDMLGKEQDPIVKSELTLALMRLQRFQ